MNAATRLVYLSKFPLVGGLARVVLRLFGVQFPRSVQVGRNFNMLHGGVGVVLHPNVKIGDRVILYHGVTLGRADGYIMDGTSKFKGIDVGDDVVLCAGSKVLCKSGVLKIGRGSIIGANAVLLNSVGEFEIWAGVPARMIGVRPTTRSEP